MGALSAALTALPTVPTDSPIACGFGTGTHSGNYAFSGGCASKVNEKLSFNAAASFVPGQDYQGKDNSYSARAGFVFKLGKTSKKEFISKKEKQLDQKVSNLQTENKELKSLIAKQNETEILPSPSPKETVRVFLRVKPKTLEESKYRPPPEKKTASTLDAEVSKPLTFILFP